MAPIRRVAFLGLGIMGRPMAANVHRKRFELTVWNRSAEKAESFAAEHGVRAAATPADAAREADAVITMVSDGPDVDEILFGPDGAAEGLRAGGIVVDMSTIAPTQSRAIARRLREKDLYFVDAPVTGSKPKAESGTLAIMVGAEQRDFDRVKPLLQAMGDHIVRIGPISHGEMAKLINNTVAGINTAALAEAFTLAETAGLNVVALVDVMEAGTGGSTMLDRKGEAMLKRQFGPLFKLEHMLKDIRHCIHEAEALGLELHAAKLAESFYARGADEGHGEDDFAAVIEAVEAASRAR